MSLSYSIFVFVAIAVISLFTNPTRSQDTYYSLLLSRGFVKYDLNPYQTSPENLSFDPWSKFVIAWRSNPTPYGPASTLIYSLPSLVTDNLSKALVFLKIVVLSFLLLSGMILAKILSLHNFYGKKKADILILSMLNPFVIQNVLIDAHNDIFIMFLALLSYYFLKKNNYYGSVVSIVAGILVKYSLILFLPIPIIKLLYDRSKTTFSKILTLVVTFVTGICMSILFWFPFGFTLKNFEGFLNGVLSVGGHAEAGVFSGVLTGFFNISNEQIRVAGILIGLVLAIYLAAKKRYTLAYIVPSLFVFLYATPFLEPWYFLWIFPFLLIYLPGIIIVFLTIFLLLMWDVIMPFYLTAAALFFFSLIFLRKNIFEMILQAKKRLFNIAR